MHALTIFVAYVAIEPYARRLWPRLLVGTMRLVSGRVGDPLVGREMLVGSTVGILLVAVTGTVVTIAWRMWLRAPTGLYELVPGFLLAALAIWVVSRAQRSRRS